jgi:hypothetical protein
MSTEPNEQALAAVATRCNLVNGSLKLLRHNQNGVQVHFPASVS